METDKTDLNKLRAHLGSELLPVLMLANSALQIYSVRWRLERETGMTEEGLDYYAEKLRQAVAHASAVSVKLERPSKFADPLEDIEGPEISGSDAEPEQEG